MKIQINKDIIVNNLKAVSAVKGLMFSKKLNEDEAVILRRNKESIEGTAIHMLFVFQKLKIIWLNKDKEIVDIKTAYPFISFLFPKKPAKYVIEMNPKNKNIEKLFIGCKLDIN